MKPLEPRMLAQIHSQAYWVRLRILIDCCFPIGSVLGSRLWLNSIAAISCGCLRKEI